jgi:predicted LPLAT superfamily acyltransferase
MWFKNKELSAGYYRLRLLYIIYKLLGPYVLKVIVVPVAFVSFLFAHSQRAASRDYFARLYRYTSNKKYKPSIFKIFRHYLSFALSLVDRMQAWCGKIDYNQINIIDKDKNDEILANIKSGKGAFILSSHVGNIEMFRGIGDFYNIDINVFIDTRHTEVFNKFLKDINPHFTTNVYPATDVGVDSAIIMADKISEGGLVVMAADRLPSTNHKYIEAELLGEKVRLPMGVFKFASLMDCNIYSLFICKNCGHYDVHMVKYPSIQSRDGYKANALIYAAKLNELILQYPYQWYNYYDYWNQED